MGLRVPAKYFLGKKKIKIKNKKVENKTKHHPSPKQRAGEMAWWLAALVALPEDLNSIPTTHRLFVGHLKVTPEGL